MVNDEENDTEVAKVTAIDVTLSLTFRGLCRSNKFQISILSFTCPCPQICDLSLPLPLKRAYFGPYSFDITLRRDPKFMLKRKLNHHNNERKAFLFFPFFEKK